MKRSVLAMMFFTLIIYAEPTIWYVHPDSALNTIQAGLDSCADNDIVLVAPGTYAGGITWPNTQGINLISEMGPENTVISGGGPSIHVHYPVDSFTVIRGFTINYGWSFWDGGGIRCDSASPLIVDNIIKNNWSRMAGGGVACFHGSSPIFRNNIISDNGCNDWGAAMYYDNGCRTFLFNNYFYSNYAFGFVSGVWCCDSAVIIGNTFAEHCDESIWCGPGSIISANTISPGAVAIHSYGPALIIDNIMNEFLVGIHCSGNGVDSTIIRNCRMSSHWSYGVAISCSDGNYIIDNCTVSHINALGLSCGNTFVTVHNMTIDSCSIGISCRACTLDIDSCTITHNSHGIYCRYDSVPSCINIHFCNISGHNLFGAYNEDVYSYFNAEHNWWGDASGPWHPDSNPGGLGNWVSDFIDFIPWLDQPVGITENPPVQPKDNSIDIVSTILSGPFLLPEGISYKIFDISGRRIYIKNPAPGIYFLEINNEVVQKIVKVQ